MTSDGPKLTKQHSKDEMKILSEYIRITKRENIKNGMMRWSLPILDGRTNFVFFSNLIIYILVVYRSMFCRWNTIGFIVGYLAADLISGVAHIYYDHSPVKFDGTYNDFARLGF